MTSHDRLGSELAGYRIDSVIGRGGMSVVYLAEEVHLERKVALKLLSPELGGDDKFRERFIRESRLAASLEHPNIITVYEARDIEGQLYIAMRYIAGGDLKSLIAREGPLDADRTVSILSQAASALDAAHREGLIHRDIKPGNILINPRSEKSGIDRVYLSDFGLTKRATSDSGITATGQFVGTLDYAAPEQFEGKPLDGRTDVYSLGCVLYECLTGEVPFTRDNEAALVYAHLMATPPKVTDKRPDLPSAIDAVMAKALAKQREDRYPTAGELVQAAAGAVGVEAAAPIPPPQPGPAPKPGLRRSPALLAGIGAAVLIVAVVVGLLLANRGGKAPGENSSSPPVAALVDYVARVDPASRTVERIAVGRHPRGIAIGEGSAWVTDAGSSSVSRIDPVSGKVTAIIRVGRGPSAIAIDRGAVWVANTLGNSVSRIDPATNRVVRTIQVDLEPNTMAVGDGAVWVADWDAGGFLVEKIDADSGRLVHVTGITTHAPTEDPPLSLGGGSLWIGGIDGVLSRVNPSSGKVSQQIDLGVSISSLDARDDSLWVGANGIPGTVLKLDPRTGKVLTRIAAGGGASQTGNVPPRPLMLTADRESVWVTDALNGTVSRIVVVSGQSSFPTNVGLVPVDVAVGLGSVWVTVDRDYVGRRAGP